MLPFTVCSSFFFCHPSFAATNQPSIIHSWQLTSTCDSLVSHSPLSTVTPTGSVLSQQLYHLLQFPLQGHQQCELPACCAGKISRKADPALLAACLTLWAPSWGLQPNLLNYEAKMRS